MLGLLAADWRVRQEPIIVVAGFLRCGMATTMAMLEAAGVPIAGRALPPTYEIPETAHSLELFMRDLFGPDRAPVAIAALPPALRDVGKRSHLDPAWLSLQAGKAVKFVNPHLMKIPSGSYRVLWLNRDERDRARSWLAYMGQPESDMVIDGFMAYFISRKMPALGALRRAGGVILELRHEDLLATDGRREAAVDRIAEFLGCPLDRAAAVKRLESTIW